ncbi:MAG: SirB1 family protein [Pseudobdellovibrionaceae bacterium]
MNASHTQDSATETLKRLGAMEEDALDPAEAALALASFSHKGRLAERYTHHLERLVEEVEERYKILVKSGATEGAGTQLAALKHIIHDKEGYHGNTENYDDLQNADLMAVIDRRKGLPVALSILHIHIARKLGWDVEALNFPGHVFNRITYGRDRLIYDPFQDCRIMEAHDLREHLKAAAGDKAELDSRYFEPMLARDVVLRLQNNIKSRQIMMEDYDGALETIALMRLIAPAESRLVFEAGVLQARIGLRERAIETLEVFLTMQTHPDARHDALLLLNELRE